MACFGVETTTVVAEECCVVTVRLFVAPGWRADTSSLAGEVDLVAGFAATVASSLDDGVGVGMDRVATVSSSSGMAGSAETLAARGSPVSSIGFCWLI
jgi:hypothetical protein